MTYRPEAKTNRTINALAQSAESRLVRNPTRHAAATLFAGWGPQIG
ncbi:MAG: hypothetical protein JO322_04900 [Candidatus Eremiobacteraeota bacterium]|nr:hypothetical protein [Candidatus Eremiobacteraeota bacterium]